MLDHIIQRTSTRPLLYREQGRPLTTSLRRVTLEHMYISFAILSLFHSLKAHVIRPNEYKDTFKFDSETEISEFAFERIYFYMLG